MKRKSFRITGKHGFDNFINMMIEMTDDEIRNDPRTEEIAAELTKELPLELTKKERRHLTEEERIERNKKIQQVKSEIYEKNSPKDDTDRLFFTIRKDAGQIPASYEYMRDGAVRSWGWELALKKCESRFIRTKKELREIRRRREEFNKSFGEEFEKLYKESEGK